MCKICFNRSWQNKIYLLALFTKEEALNINITHWKTFDIDVNDNDINFPIIWWLLKISKMIISENADVQRFDSKICIFIF